MSTILDGIIASSFRLNQPAFAYNMIEGQNRREQLDSSLQNDNLYRQTQQFNLGQLQEAAANERELAGLSEQLFGVPQMVQDKAEQAMANFDASAARGGVNPALRDQAMAMVRERGMEAIPERQQKLFTQMASRSPELRDLMLQSYLQPEQGEQFRRLTPDDPEWGSLPTDQGQVWGIKPDGTPVNVNKQGGGNVSVSVNNQTGKNVDRMESAGIEDFTAMGNDYRAERDAAQSNIANIQQFRRLQSQVATGKFTGSLVELDKSLEAMGIGPVSGLNIPAAEALRSVQLEFVMDRVEQSSGAISEQEMAIFEAAAPNLSNTPEGNAFILDFAERVAERQIDVQREYVKFKRTLTPDQYGQASDLWDDHLNNYLETNPIFTKEEMSGLYGGANLESDFGDASGYEENATATGPGGIKLQAKSGRWIKVQ